MPGPGTGPRPARLRNIGLAEIVGEELWYLDQVKTS